MSKDNAIAYMQRAIALAKLGHAFTRPNPRVGAVLVLGDRIVGEGYHHAYGQAHAEVNAIAQAGDEAAGATCYVTLEPCAHFGKTPPCIHALVNARVAKVVIACLDPNPLVNGSGVAYLKAHGIEVEVGVCEQEANELNPAFMHRMKYKKPYYALKSAMSMDGKTAMKDGRSQWITGSDARKKVHGLRAQADAIVTGIETILLDDAQMTVRDDEVIHNPLFRQPKRFVLDSTLRIPLDAKVLKSPGQTYIVTSSKDEAKIAALQSMGVQVCTQEQSGRIDLNTVEKLLLENDCHHVMVEAGATLIGSYLAADMVNAWHVFIAPKLMGAETRGLCEWSTPTLSSAKLFDLNSVERLGADLYCCYYPKSLENA